MTAVPENKKKLTAKWSIICFICPPYPTVCRLTFESSMRPRVFPPLLIRAIECLEEQFIYLLQKQRPVFNQVPSCWVRSVSGWGGKEQQQQQKRGRVSWLAGQGGRGALEQSGGGGLGWGPGEGPQWGQAWGPAKNERHIHGTWRCGEEGAGGRTCRAAREGRAGGDAATRSRGAKRRWHVTWGGTRRRWVHIRQGEKSLQVCF